MTWTANIDETKIMSGPYRIGLGADTSENEIGECEDVVIGYTTPITYVNAGDLIGNETIIDGIMHAPNVEATFVMFQSDTTNINRAIPNSTLSTGATSKSLTIDIQSTGGRLLSGSDQRIRFHHYGTALLTDHTKDFIFPAGVLIVDGEITISGRVGLSCKIIALPDSNHDKIIFGINQT